MPFIFNLNNCQPRKPTNICIPTLVHCLVKHERFLGVSYIQIHQSTLNAIWMIKRVDRPVACVCRVCGFFSCLENKLYQQTNGCIWAKWTREKMRSGRTDVLDRPSVLCSILCLYSLKEYMVSVQVKYMELWTSREVFSQLRHFFFFFLHEWRGFFYVLCYQWCCVWMLNILKISQI